MKEKLGLNKHQKTAHKAGEVKVSRAEVPLLLKLSCSHDPEDRLHAAKYLCPCHIQGRIAAVWDAVLRMMEDEDRRVRFQAWHTWEDGGLPEDPLLFARMQQILAGETDSKVRNFAHTIIGQRLAEQNQIEMTRLHLVIKPTQRGKCDFCGAANLPVNRALDTVIGERPALICESCASAQ